MNELTDALSLLFSRKDSRRVFILSTVLFILILLVALNGKNALEVLSFTSLSFVQKISLSLQTLFQLGNTFTLPALLLSVLGSLLGGINLSLAYTYMRLRGEIILRSGLYSGIGLLMAFLGVGCAACGTALLSVLLGFFGFSTMLSVFPYQGEELGYIGIIILLIATYTLSRKVVSPAVC